MVILRFIRGGMRTVVGVVVGWPRGGAPECPLFSTSNKKSSVLVIDHKR